MASPTVYVTTNPEALAVIPTWEAEMKQWRKQATAFIRELDPDNKREAVRSRERFVGISHREDWPVLKGWRVKDDRPRGVLYLVPSKNSKAGLAADADLRKIAIPKPLQSRWPGMSGECWIPQDNGNRWSHSIHYPQPLHDEANGTLYIAFQCDVTESDHAWDKFSVDSSEVKLSEYFLVKERLEGKTAVTHA